MDYEDKAVEYYSNIRKDLIRLIDGNQKGIKVMEIGAAYGETLFYLKTHGIAAEAVGVELFEDYRNKSRYREINRFIFGNIEELDFPEYENYFDLILLPDVIEHLIEPTTTLDKVYKYLNPTGQIIVSMPNIRHYSAFVKIFIKGEFKYEESGIFDYTHRRFYCRKDIQKLLEKSHFQTIASESSIKSYKGRSFAKLVNILTFGVLEEFLSYQYFFKSKKV